MYKILSHLFKVTVGFLLITHLAGCTSYTVMGQTTSTKVSCSNSRVLLTDLTMPNNQRRYLLPDTTSCPKIILY